MPPRTSLIGQTFGRLIVIDAGPPEPATNRVYYTSVAICDCGSVVCVRNGNLASGQTRSCGCLRKEATAQRRRIHGQAAVNGRTRTYAAWRNLIERCYRSTNPQFANYGGRGITVCDEWRHSYPAFYAYMGECPPGLEIERIDNEQGYQPGNVKWGTETEQSRNRRNNIPIAVHGFTGCLSAACEFFGVKYSKAYYHVVRCSRPPETIFKLTSSH